MSDTFTIINKTKSQSARTLVDGLPFKEIKEDVLGPGYELELVLVTPKESDSLNRRYHNHTGPTNILSFPLTPSSGQIFICPTFAKKEAPRFKRAYDNYLTFLFIHGLIHLKGFSHGSKMDIEERRIREKFDI